MLATFPTWSMTRPPIWTCNALGKTNDLSARTFNLPLIIAGILVPTARYATRGIPTNPPARRRRRAHVIVIALRRWISGMSRTGNGR